MAIERWIAIGDTHGDKADEGAVAEMFGFARWWKPVHRVHVGDAADLRWLRSGASCAERAEDVKADLTAGLELLAKFKPTAYLFGNHEHRLVRALSSTEGEVRAYVCEILEKIDKAVGHKCKQYRYGVRAGVHQLGDLRFIHGYRHGITAARMSAMEYGNVVFGHTHGIDAASVGRYPERVTGRTIGCLCSLDMDYAMTQPGALRWSHGFAYGTFNTTTGRTTVWQAEKHAGEWNFPSENGRG